MRNGLQFLFIGILSIAGVETAARLISSVPSRVMRLEPERIWEDRFLEMMSKSPNIIMAGFHRPHPTRGWTLAEHAHETFEGFTYTTNERGYRSLTPYTPDPSKSEVLAIGDSMTFGIEADDTATWPYLLQAEDPHLNVINLGVGGYGIDQMYITLRETIGEYHPRLVVVAFIDDDLRRAFLSFRDYKKPRFMLRHGQLQLTNVPVGPPGQVIKEIQHRRGWLDKVYTFRIARGIIRRALGYSAPPDSMPLGEREREFVTRLFDEMYNVSREHHAEFLLVYFSHADGLTNASLVEEGEEFLRSYGAHRPFPTLDTRPFFLRQRRHDWVRGHYQAREAHVVSDAIDEQILRLLSTSRSITQSDAESQ